MTTHGSISSTMSTFDPSREAIVSTRQLDQDYIIDSTALRKAFPDFSTGSTNSDIDVSVEVGRGHEYQYAKVGGLIDDSRNRQTSYKENIDPLPLRKHQDSHRRPQQDRPALGTLNRRSSRFSPPKTTRQRPGEQETMTSQQPTTTSTLLKTLNAARKTSSSKTAPQPKPQPATTYDIPEVTSISEIVTGTLHFNSRVDRVTSTPHVPLHLSLPLPTVPIPTDQQALFAALQLLHDKVVGMEEGQAQMRRTIEDLRSECSSLKHKLKKRQARLAVEQIDPDEEDVFDISMRGIGRQKSQEMKTTHVVPAPAPMKTSAPAEKTEVVEVLRESVKENARANIIRREVIVPAQSIAGAEQKSFGVEIKVNFQGLSLS